MRKGKYLQKAFQSLIQNLNAEEGGVIENGYHVVIPCQNTEAKAEDVAPVDAQIALTKVKIEERYGQAIAPVLAVDDFDKDNFICAINGIGEGPVTLFLRTNYLLLNYLDNVMVELHSDQPKINSIKNLNIVNTVQQLEDFDDSLAAYFQDDDVDDQSQASMSQYRAHLVDVQNAISKLAKEIVELQETENQNENFAALAKIEAKVRKLIKDKYCAEIEIGEFFAKRKQESNYLQGYILLRGAEKTKQEKLKADLEKEILTQNEKISSAKAALDKIDPNSLQAVRAKKHNEGIIASANNEILKFQEQLEEVNKKIESLNGTISELESKKRELDCEASVQVQVRATNSNAATQLPAPRPQAATNSTASSSSSSGAPAPKPAAPAPAPKPAAPAPAPKPATPAANPAKPKDYKKPADIPGSKGYNWKLIGGCVLTGCAICAIGLAIYKGKMPKIDLSGIKLPSSPLQQTQSLFAR